MKKTLLKGKMIFIRIARKFFVSIITDPLIQGDKILLL